MAVFTTPETHVDEIDVECPECEALPGDKCVGLFAGRIHSARADVANEHELNVYEQDGHTIKTCPECDYVDVN